MCGIVGYIGGQQATPIILDGLRKLEYRGYDSAGIATLSGGESAIRRSQGKLVNLDNLLRRTASERFDRHRPHPLGHPWQTLRDQRPSA